MGFGWSYRRGVEAASLAHIVMVHGDNAWGWATLREFFGHTGEADVIIGYTRDMLTVAHVGPDGHLEDLHPARQPDHVAALAVLQRAADSPSADPQEPAD